MPPLITLVPNSGIQFWDLDLDVDALPRQARSFWEEPLGGPPAAEQPGLSHDGKICQFRTYSARSFRNERV